MTGAKAHQWEFRPRFCRHAFGWKSQPAIKRIKEAVAEISKSARKDPLLAAEGAVLFLEKLSPAIEQVDSSSGAIGTAVNRAIEKLVPVIAGAPCDAKQRDAWLERIWDAYQDDGIPYLEVLGGHWGQLCASTEVASAWADRLIGLCRVAWSPDPELRGYFKGITNCLSALLAADRHDDILELLELAPYRLWHFTQYGARALAAMGQVTEAIRYAEEVRDINDDPASVALVCESILLAAGRTDEAYLRYGLEANQSGTHVAWFRAVVRKYPHKEPAEVLADLVALTPGEEGKWFAAAKAAKMFDEAIVLARQTPCSPQTLTRAARDFAVERPAFAVEAGMTALHWLVEGYGYDVTDLHVRDAYRCTMVAAENAGDDCVETTRKRIQTLVAGETFGERFVTKVLGRELGLS